MADVTVRGVEQLIENLARLDKATRTTVIQEAAERGGEIFTQAASQYAPIGKGDTYYKGKRFKAGRLARSIALDVHFRDIATIRARTKVNVPYGHLVEYGHKTLLGRKIRRQDKGQRSGASRKSQTQGKRAFTRPRPFMRPAFDNHVSKVENEVLQTVDYVYWWLCRGLPK